ncbi:MAG: TaqI-like C-terminal specificity domain-containing protein [Bacteroidota bacterium]|jgi:adenine-specific DNA-methyltransferase
MQEAFDTIKQLVADFKAQESAYLSPSYQESQIRQDFIDKFFTALGWDVAHNLQKNPYQQEVHIENKVHMAGSQRRADYAFFLSPNFRDPKFFVEAKKPSRNLANPDDYYQTIRYGWNANTPIAILTDFEEFHILDCRYKPDIKGVMSQKIEYFHYSDYANEEKFARIYWLFSHEAVASGSIEKWVAELPKLRGKAIKGGYQPVDEAFLEELDKYREILAKAFKKSNPDLQSEELTESIQRTIDRLVFIRFLEDKQIEEPEIIQLASKKSTWKGFLELCKQLDPKYNGLVFKPHKVLDGKEFVPPDDEEFGTICRELSDPHSPYNFDQIPISILGSIYERFLGKVVHATDKRVKVEEKPEVRKAGGVYYTPEYIVRYIVSETVGKLIDGKTPKEIAEMTFVDIACGSGSFLIEVYNQLLEYHIRYYVAHPEKQKEADVFERDGKLHLTLKKKKEILLNNVYGVDIDFQATEVTQLSLYLKLLEDVTMHDAHQFGMFKETILPDLRNNIINGNSLIGRDIIEGQLFADVDENKLKPMNFEDAFPKAMKRGGFDAVLGNPPYVRQELLSNLKSYFELRFKVYQGTADLYAYFIEKGVSLLRSGGLFSYIVANKWMRANYAVSLRKWLTSQGIIQLIDFGDLPVFQGVTTYPCIIVVKKGFPEEHISITKVESLENLDLSTYIKSAAFTIRRTQLKDDGWTLSDETSSSLLKKLKSCGVPLGEYVKGNIYRGVLTGFNEAFVIEETTKNRLILEDPKCAELIKPFLAGRDIKRYESPKAERYLIFTRRGIDIKKYPSIEKHLSKFKEYLTPKPKTFTGSKWKGRKPGNYKWFEIQDSVEYYEAFDKSKIIFPNICKMPQFAFDKTKLYTNQKCFIIAIADLYLLGVLNSAITFFLFRKVLPKLRGDYYEPSYVYFKDFPISTINFDDPQDKSRHDAIVKLVEQMLNAKEKLSNAKTEAETNRFEHLCQTLDRQIDEAVYELYGLTEEEIKIVEGKND